MSILKEVPTVAYKIRRHDVFTRHGREWMAADYPAWLGDGNDVQVPTVGGGVVILPRDEPLTVRRHVGGRSCTA
ncbi:hypothetical protein [Streptomyces sp. NPDC091259]|uniref:hypothetical protein n=1 Tax=Streptomyces sp. NPDC091259 TaxID=3365976 RepID=UPI0037F9F078